MCIEEIGKFKFAGQGISTFKTYLVHVDRVRHMHVNDQLVNFNPDAGKD